MSGTVLKDLNKYIKAIRNRRTPKAKKLGMAPVAGVSHARGTSTAEMRRDAAQKTKSAVQRKVIENITKGQAHWVNHTLANITGNIGKEYRSGIPITKVDPQTGERWYGSTPIVHLPNFEYDLNAAKEAVVISGLSHLHALLKQRDTAAAEKEAQNHVLKHATFGMHQAHRNRSARVANNLVQSAGSYSISNAFSRPLTVSFSPKIAKKLIDECLEVIHKDLEKGIIEEGKNSRNDVLAARNKNIQSNIFWALPYIGIEEQQYREKKS